MSTGEKGNRKVRDLCSFFLKKAKEKETTVKTGTNAKSESMFFRERWENPLMLLNTIELIFQDFSFVQVTGAQIYVALKLLQKQEYIAKVGYQYVFLFDGR